LPCREDLWRDPPRVKPLRNPPLKCGDGERNPPKSRTRIRLRRNPRRLRRGGCQQCGPGLRFHAGPHFFGRVRTSALGRAVAAMLRRVDAAVLAILAVADGCIFAATGLSRFPGGAVLAISGAHPSVRTLAAIHGRLVALRMFPAASHRLAVYVLAAGLALGLAGFVVAARCGSLADVCMMAMMCETSTVGRFPMRGRSRLGTGILLSNTWKTRRQRQG